MRAFTARPLVSIHTAKSAQMSSQPKCYQIKKPALHGDGVFARFHIPQNCEILQENPLWVLTPEQGQKVQDRAGDPQNLDLTLLGRFWSSLKREVQTNLYKLHGFKPATSREGRQWCQGQYQKLGEYALKVYVFNALGRITEPVIQTIVYDEASRFNHSCELSAEYRLDEANKSIIITAARDVDAGDEITLQYTKPLASYADQTKLLRERYDFACACALCSADQAERDASDARRAELGAYQLDIVKFEQALRSDSKLPFDRMRATALANQSVALLRLLDQMSSHMSREHVSTAAMWESLCVLSIAAYVVGSDQLSDQLYDDAWDAMEAFGMGPDVQRRCRQLRAWACHILEGGR